MRDLSPSDVKNIGKEDIVQLLIDRVNKKTTVIRCPSIVIYGLKYTAKKAGVKIKYDAITEGDPAVSVQGLVITLDVISEVTTNQDLIALVENSVAAQTLIYVPEIVDAEAIVYSPMNEHGIG